MIACAACGAFGGGLHIAFFLGLITVGFAYWVLTHAGQLKCKFGKFLGFAIMIFAVLALVCAGSKIIKGSAPGSANSCAYHKNK